MSLISSSWRAAVALPLLSLSAEAVVVASFTSPDLSDGTVSWNTFANATNINGGADRRSLLTFGESNSFNLDTSLGYPALFGGSSATWIGQGGQTTQPLHRVGEAGVNTTGADRILYQYGTSNGVAAAFKTLTIIPQSSFSALSTGTLSLTSATPLRLNSAFTSNVDSISMNLVVKNGGTYYMSTQRSTGFSFSNLDILDPTTATWVAFDPFANGGDLSGVTSVGSGGSTVVFDDVQGFGYFIEGQGATTGTAQIGIGSFEFNAVPEPSAALSALASMGVLALRRRRR